MPKFKVKVQRNYVMREEAEIEVEAESPNDAIDRAMLYEWREGIGEWSEVEGDSAADPDSYEWTTIGPDGREVTDEGTDD